VGIEMVPDRDRIWRLGRAPVRPGAVPYRVDADGLRASAPQGASDAGAPLVLTVGDSSIFGQDLPDGVTIHDQLARALARSGVAARTGTLAVPGYSSTQSLATLDAVGWDRRPALLVIAQVWSDAKLDVMRDADLLAAMHGPLGTAEWLLSRSAIYVQLRARLNAARGLAPRHKVSWPTANQYGVRRTALAQYRDNLRRMIDEARARDIGVVFLGLANTEVLRDGHPPDAPWTPYFTVFYAVAERAGVPVVRARDVYAAAQVARPLSDGIHPSPGGARALAGALAEALVTAGWPTSRLVPTAVRSFDVPADPLDGTAPADEGGLLLRMGDR
jgi:hypothetical protein